MYSHSHSVMWIYAIMYTQPQMRINIRPNRTLNIHFCSFFFFIYIFISLKRSCIARTQNRQQTDDACWTTGSVHVSSKHTNYDLSHWIENTTHPQSAYYKSIVAGLSSHVRCIADCRQSTVDVTIYMFVYM